MMSEACHVKLGIWQGSGFRKVEENSAERREGLESKDTTKSIILQRFTLKVKNDPLNVVLCKS